MSAYNTGLIQSFIHGTLTRQELAAARACDDEHNASGQNKAAEDGRDGHGLFLLVRDLERAEIDIFFLVVEAEAAEGKADDAQHDEDDSDDCGRFHEGLLRRSFFA